MYDGALVGVDNNGMSLGLMRSSLITWSKGLMRVMVVDVV